MYKKFRVTGIKEEYYNGTKVGERKETHILEAESETDALSRAKRLYKLENIKVVDIQAEEEAQKINEEQEKDTIYDNARDLFEEKRYAESLAEFRKISGYKNSDKWIEILNDKKIKEDRIKTKSNSTTSIGEKLPQIIKWVAYALTWGFMIASIAIGSSIPAIVAVVSIVDGVLVMGYIIYALFLRHLLEETGKMIVALSTFSIELVFFVICVLNPRIG